MKQGAGILVIDDEPSVCRFLEVSLGLEGYRVQSFHSGKKGLQAIKDSHPDLVLLDLQLPDMSGLEVLNKLREWSHLPVLVLTVKNQEADKVALLNAGADDYLTKPFSVPELVARIKVALRHYFGQFNQEIYINGLLKINFLSRIVTVDDQEIKLTQTEYNFLKLLAHHSGKVVTQHQLLREIWGPESVEHYHYLRIYVGQLRKKLERPPTLEGLIITEPGVGYRLREVVV